MSGVDEVSVALQRPRRDVPSVAKTGEFSDDDVIMNMTPLEQLAARRRRTRTDIPFSSLTPISYRSSSRRLFHEEAN